MCRGLFECILNASMVANCHTPPRLTLSHDKSYIRSHIRHILHRPFSVRTQPRVLLHPRRWIVAALSSVRNEPTLWNGRSAWCGRWHGLRGISEKVSGAYFLVTLYFDIFFTVWTLERIWPGNGGLEKHSLTLWKRSRIRIIWMLWLS